MLRVGSSHDHLDSLRSSQRGLSWQRWFVCLQADQCLATQLMVPPVNLAQERKERRQQKSETAGRYCLTLICDTAEMLPPCFAESSTDALLESLASLLQPILHHMQRSCLVRESVSLDCHEAGFLPLPCYAQWMPLVPGPESGIGHFSSAGLQLLW